ncbi:MAG: hypothetical protein IJ946_00765 [Clostridia bacterium]|nr:hypothetical protein [Clostridia bacterium]
MKYVIDHDYHIHSYLTPCAGHPPEQNCENILAYGKRMGMKDLVITDHFWDAQNVVTTEKNWFRRYGYSYIKEILPFPTDEECTFHLGCEADMDLNFNLGVSEKLYDKLEFIIVATSHLHAPGWTVTEEKQTVAERAELYMKRNFKLLDSNMPFHKVGLAHFTCSLIAANCEGSNIDILNHITDKEFKVFFSRVAKVGMGVELNMTVEEANTEEILRPYRIAKECGCKFYLGSDAHSLGEFDDVGERFVTVINALSLTEADKFRPFG